MPGQQPAQAGDYCKPVLTEAGEGITTTDLIHCEEHGKISQQVYDLITGAQQAGTEEALQDAWMQAAKLWTDAVKQEYDRLIQDASETEKPIFEKERDLFFEQLRAYQEELQMLHPGNAVMVEATGAELLRKQCVYLCYETHAAPSERPDSLISGSFAPAEIEDKRSACQARIQPGTGDAVIRETICEAHRKVDQAVLAMVDEPTQKEDTTSQELEAVWQSAKKLWLTELDTIANARYLAADEDGQKIVAASRIAFGNWLKAREECLKVFYPDRQDIVNEVMTLTIRGRVADQCED